MHISPIRVEWARAAGLRNLCRPVTVLIVVLQLCLTNSNAQEANADVKALCVQFAVRSILAGNLSNPEGRGRYFAQNINNFNGVQGMTREKAIAEWKEFYRLYPVRNYSVTEKPVLASTSQEGDLILCTVNIPMSFTGESLEQKPLDVRGVATVQVEYDTNKKTLAVVSYNSPNMPTNQSAPSTHVPSNDNVRPDGETLRQPDESAVGQIINVTEDDPLKLRSGAGANTDPVRDNSGEIIALQPGENVTVFTQDWEMNGRDKWYRVSWKGYKGYLRSKFLDF